MDKKLEAMRVRSCWSKLIPVFDGEDAYWWLICIEKPFDSRRTTKIEKVSIHGGEGSEKLCSHLVCRQDDEHS